MITVVDENMDRDVFLQDDVSKLPDGLEGHQVEGETLVCPAFEAGLATFGQSRFQFRRTATTRTSSKTFEDICNQYVFNLSHGSRLIEMLYSAY